MKQKREKRRDAYSLYVIVGLIAAVVVGYHSSSFFATGNLIVAEEFKTPQKCLFVSDCQKLSEEKGILLTCRLAFSSAREKSCLPPLTEGIRCTVNEDCDAGLACIKTNPDALHWICKRAPRKPGETCQKREDCGENTTCVLLEGADSMTCEKIPRQLNEHCAVDYDCTAGLKCIFSVKQRDLIGQCLPPRAHSEPCRSETDCEEGLYCRDTRAGGSVCMTGDEFKKMWR
ncbi:MAG: hypothetical protein Q7R76_00490 [Candidatus Woesearchaeota archaeon]|nr:hypothetical protein [Candidatus Woesearchaeota archaeon]